MCYAAIYHFKHGISRGGVGVSIFFGRESTRIFAVLRGILGITAMRVGLNCCIRYAKFSAKLLE